MATYQQLEAQRDLIERTLIAAKREVDRLETARAAVDGRIWRLIHNMTDETCDHVTVNEFGDPITPPMPDGVAYCAWCGTLTFSPVTMALNFGRTARVCSTCTKPGMPRQEG